MNFTKKNTIISFSILLSAAAFQMIKYETLSWIETSNILFMIAGVFLIIGLSGLILASGSFDFFHFSLRKTLRREKKTLDEEEPLNPHALSASIGKSYRNVLTIGLILLLISIFCLWDYIL
ncbi:DUF3899 domain-containing protein [Trichococcus ilyis]|uniref:DUF3899 domain-containing protein n=1 Tax=Trichococcus ilyis TaxID=640938 RepID=A0A143Y6R5_9LACT|nr:DUF3899 domain-containing protein [Trichococcus ilyis]CZQ81340.1 Hypothetical protein TR210_129 [Trichococcus ilyis]SEI53315.1 protein of unknown function [Trichococcus ilyis]